MPAKLALLVRTDLGMGRGKIAAQAAHAAVEAVLRSYCGAEFAGWLRDGQPKVVLRVGSEEELSEVCAAAEAAGLPVAVIRDAGRTQVQAGAVTCCAIGPAAEDRIDQVTGGLSLLSAPSLCTVRDVVPVSVALRRVRKVFSSGGSSITAVDGVDLDVGDGEFFSMLGPSGSGKTTVLRMIAGFEQPTEGQILLGGDDVSRLAPFERDVNTVFQDYALFPHMSVAENIGYGLRVKGVSRAERRARVAAALTTVQLEGFGPRRPSQLSGGQRQRVALARALVNRPKVLLLDEPLGALDLRLREGMQVELKAIQREVGITFLFVTHDQGEAMTMSDRIAVFNQGRIEQVGSPREIYDHPATAFVAGFVGTANVLTGAVARTVLGLDGTFSIRPEKITVGEPADRPAAGRADEVTVDGTLADVVYAGPETRFQVDTDAGVRMVALEPNAGAEPSDGPRTPGQRVRLAWRREHVSRIPAAAAVEPAADRVLTDR